MKKIKITNITHEQGQERTILDLYGQCILPGEFMFLPEQLVDEKIKAHERIGHIMIGDILNFNGPTQADILKKLEAQEAEAAERELDSLTLQDMTTSDPSEIEGHMTLYKKSKKIR